MPWLARLLRAFVHTGAQAAVFFQREGATIGGYDVVAYFTEGRPVVGDTRFACEHGGARFLFASAANRDAFLADPPRYAPQYGGFCAFGVAGGYKATTDPQAFAIVDGKLYLNYNRAVQERWLAERAGFIAKADANWPVARTQAEVRG